MYGLPQTTEVRKQLPKKAIYAKFELKPSQRESFDADIARIDIVAVVSPSTVPAVAQGENIKEFYVLAVQLKRKEYDAKNIALLSRLIPQKMVIALHFEEQVQFAISHTKLITSDWKHLTPNSSFLILQGLTLDSVWDNIVISIGDIHVEQSKSVAEQISADDQRAKLLAQIATLERKMANEKQPRRKREYFEQIKKIKSQI
ncbi:MAG: DUF4391 domain-containing protein [Bacteroidales bacterium]|nr:DUF4391 domain-containing protein [Bacteroidales bacterium]